MNAQQIQVTFNVNVTWPDAVPQRVIDSLLSNAPQDLGLPVHDAASVMNAVFQQMKTSPELTRQIFSRFVLYCIEDTAKEPALCGVDDDAFGLAMAALTSTAGEPFASLFALMSKHYELFTESTDIQLDGVKIALTGNADEAGKVTSISEG